MLYYTYTETQGVEMRLMLDAGSLFTAVSTPLMILGTAVAIWTLGCVTVMLAIKE